LNRPFNSSRYARLLEGLEITVLPLQQINLGDRSDPEFYSKENLAIERSLRNHHARPLGELCTLIASAFYPAATDLYSSGDVPFARCVDCINHPVISTLQADEFERIPHWFMEECGQIHKVGRGDIILTKVGTPCFASIVHDYDEIALSRTVLGLIGIRDVNPYYLTAFLRCRYGFNQLMRQREQTIQFQLTLERIRKVLIFQASASIQQAIEKRMHAHLAALQTAAAESAKAEQNLLRGLGLEGWHPPEALTYTRYASEAFSSRRLDAEYFRPRFQALKQHIEARGECKRLGDVLSFCQRGKQPDYSDSGLPVINSKHVRNGMVMRGEENRLALPVEEGLKIQVGDVLINGTGVGTIGRTAAYFHESPALPDNHVTILRLQEDSGIDPVFLAVQLNSLIGQMQVEQYFKGSSGQIELYPSDIEGFSIWKAPMKTQQTIRQSIDAAHGARREARTHMERAKRAVEIAIEESEAAAMMLLEASEDS
jgi:restriction endonuclease S subunit